MDLDTDVVKKLLRSFEFENLFAELGWNRLDIHAVDITVDHTSWRFDPVAVSHLVQVYVCWSDHIPGAVLRHKIDSSLARHAREHLLIFAENGRSRQVWQWVAHEAGQPHYLRSFEWRKGQDGSILAQRLAEIAIPLNEEEFMDLTTVTYKLKNAFDRDRVTKRFYDRFAKERERFQASIMGLSEDDAKWYTSVIIDRLMFIYFLQKQGFLADDDRDYLRVRMNSTQLKGPDQYYSDFLTTLFFEGFAKPTDQRSPEAKCMLGNIPYLNGGLFAPHALEVKYEGKIHISDSAFDKLLRFFDEYQWTLDDRVVAQENESDTDKGPDSQINPDVLGYIFEKYVNQKQMGAYYTKEDITGYISQETIIPRLFDMVRAKYKPAFAGEHSVFTLLKDDPDTYIYASMRKGARDEEGNKMSLPDNIAQGLHDVAKRGDWNKPADAAYALPTEIWREVVARTQRYEEVRKHCTDGDITDINDVITYNLDIRQFAQDAIAQSEDPMFVLEFFKALTTITVLDPTVGSGAFLFAALNILTSLYEVCLQRMEQFQQDGVTYTGQALKAVQQFDGILREADKHSNRRYYILKSIVVHNLYGVDIMEEAVEICKLRLFLRLVAELRPGQPVEPLPDIDFNIKAGNTLVGYAHLQDAVNAAKKQLFGEKTAVRMQQKAEDLARLYREMQDQQMVLGGCVTPEDKRALQERRKQLIDELDEYLAYDYGIQTKKPAAFQEWYLKTQPFHWFAEFYDIIEKGEFDVVIGNPPYVPVRKVSYDVAPMEPVVIDCGDLFSLVIERAWRLAGTSSRLGLIVPLSATSTPTMGPLQKLLEDQSSALWTSYYSASDQPASLFSGVRHRLLILLATKGIGPAEVHSTGFTKWFSEERLYLFETKTVYIGGLTGFPKLGTRTEREILEALQPRHALSSALDQSGLPVYYHNAPVHWNKVFDFVPAYRLNGVVQRSSHLKEIRVSRASWRPAIVCALNSSLFYWYTTLWSNCRDLTDRDVRGFPLGVDQFSRESMPKLNKLCQRLMADFRRNARMYHRETKNGDVTEFDAFYPAMSRSVIDEIDTLLGAEMGLTCAQVDFVRSFHLKYRVGQTDVVEDEE